MSKRDKNIRKTCDEIDNFVMRIQKALIKENISSAIWNLGSIPHLTHRIKRTTWRGDSIQTKPKNSLEEWGVKAIKSKNELTRDTNWPSTNNLLFRTDY